MFYSANKSATWNKGCSTFKKKYLYLAKNFSNPFSTIYKAP